MPNTIALVDDDRNILTSVSMALESEGFSVRCFSDGAEALKGLSAQPVDLAVLDIKMPRMDGMELLGQLRRQSAIPVIFLTSKDDEVDELLGLRMGADDYIKKPFSQRLLIERIRALIRRGELARERDDPQGEPVIVRGHLILDPARHLCTWKGGPVELTVTETEPGIQGDRVSGARKPATLQTGLVVQVPLFVNIGDVLKVDTRSGDYLTRA